jgi:beta-glucosidase
VSDPDVRAREVENQMTDDERFSLIVGVMGAGELWPLRDERIPPGVPMSAGYVPGIPRLGRRWLQASTRRSLAYRAT